MNPKLLATILILAAAAAGSFFILKNPVPLPEPPAPDLKKPSDLFSQDSGQWFEKISDKLDSEVKKLSEGKEGAADNSSNATKQAAKVLFEEMKEKDQAGENPFGISSANPDNPENKKIIEEILKTFENSDSSFEPAVSYQDIKISSNNSKEAKAKYLSAVFGISQRYLSDPKFQRTPEELMGDINSDCFGPGGSINKELAQAYKNAGAEYLNLEAPSDWALLHKTMVVYFKKAELIYGGIANCLSDPITGFTAVKKLPELASAAQSIQEELDKNAKAAGL